MFRLAIVTSYFPIREQPYRGHSAYQTLRRMTSRMEIKAFCPFAGYPALLRPRNFSYVDPDPTYSPDGIPTTYIRYPALPALSRPVNGFTAAEHVLPHLRMFRPDLILSYTVYPDGYGALKAGRKLGVPVILGAIGSDINRIPDRLSAWFTRKALREASFVLTVSDHLRGRAIQLGVPPERARAVRNGCDTSIFKVASKADARLELGLDPRSSVILFVGWLAATKGLRELLEAVIRLLPSRPNLQVYCIGEGDLRTEIEAKAADSPAKEHFHFAGQRSSVEVARWLAAADVTCLPSYAEGCPNSVIEALACGRPVVATRVGGIPELVDSDSGILIPPGDSAALADALNRALSIRWDELAIAQRCCRSWEQVAEETLQICMECLDHRVSHRF